jgi:hypothetical protein
MSQIYRYLNLIFSFLSDEHLPPHVHVKSGDKQSIFDLIIKDGILIDMKIRRKEGFEPIDPKDKGIVKTFIRVYYAQIVAKWFEYFILNIDLKPETIRKIENLTVDTETLKNNLEELNKKFYPQEKKTAKTTKKRKQL